MSSRWFDVVKWYALAAPQPELVLRKTTRVLALVSNESPTRFPYPWLPDEYTSTCRQSVKNVYIALVEMSWGILDNQYFSLRPSEFSGTAV